MFAYGFFPYRRAGSSWRGCGRTLALLLVAGCLAACSAPQTRYQASPVLLAGIERVAVLPFRNHTEHPHAAERVRDVFMSAALANGSFVVAGPGDVERFLRLELPRGQLSVDQLLGRRLGEELSVQAYLEGSIDEYSVVRSGSYAYPVVAATLRLVEAHSGDTLWQTSASASGYSALGRLFGVEAPDLTAVTFRLVQRTLDAYAVARP